MHDYTPAFVMLQVLLSVLIWTTSAAAGAIVGASKGRASEGAVWGLLLGPIGIVIAAILSPRVELPQPGNEAGPSLATVRPSPSGLIGDVPRPRAARTSLGDEMR